MLKEGQAELLKTAALLPVLRNEVQRILAEYGVR
jgi:hypothetical protein